MLRNFSFLCWVDVFTCSVSAHKFCRLSWCLLTPCRFWLCVYHASKPWRFAISSLFCLWQGAEILWESLLCELWTSRPNRFFRHILWAVSSCYISFKRHCFRLRETPHGWRPKTKNKKKPCELHSFGGFESTVATGGQLSFSWSVCWPGCSSMLLGLNLPRNLIKKHSKQGKQLASCGCFILLSIGHSSVWCIGPFAVFQGSLCGIPSRTSLDWATFHWK